MQMVQKTSADQYDDRINAINQDISRYQAEAVRLNNEAKTLQSALAIILTEKAQIQAQLDISQAKYDQLIQQIADTKKKIIDNQDALGVTIANLFVDDQVTPIEMLFSSSNISDFLDKQEYRSSVRDELTATISSVKDLKESLETQKAEVERVLADQKTQRDLLVAKESAHQDLLNTTQGQEAAYQTLTAQKTSEVQKIKSEQVAYYELLASKGHVVDVSAGDPNKGGYPAYLANNSQDSLVDPWGMYNRECVSYTAWKVHQAYGNMPYWGGKGNAWQWAFSGWNWAGVQTSYDTGIWHTANTETASIPSGSEPKAGSVAVANGAYGHVAWVEAVLGDQIKISQYNWYVASLGGWGQYSEMIVDKSIFQRYIYFGEW